MQVAAVTIDNHEEQAHKLQAYLDFMGWDKKEFSNEKLESMLAASCLRYLEGLNHICFVIGLAEHILKKRKNELNLSLHYATEILHDLHEKLHNHSVDLNDRHTIENYIDDAQEVITSRRYLSAVS